MKEGEREWRGAERERGEVEGGEDEWNLESPVREELGCQRKVVTL